MSLPRAHVLTPVVCPLIYLRAFVDRGPGDGQSGSDHIQPHSSDGQLQGDSGHRGHAEQVLGHFRQLPVFLYIQSSG